MGADQPDYEQLANVVRQFVAAGNKIEAIKVFREQTGIGLAEAKSFVESIEQRLNKTSIEQNDSGIVTQSRNPSDQFVDLLRQGQKIAAIKLYRQRNSVDLQTAKDAIERIAADHGLQSVERSGCLGSVLMAIGSAEMFWRIMT